MFSMVQAPDLLSFVWTAGKLGCCIPMIASEISLPEMAMLSLNPAPFKKEAGAYAPTHVRTHARLWLKSVGIPQRQSAAVAPRQVSLHRKAQQLKRVGEAARVFGGRITNLCLQLTNPITAVYLDHYSRVIKIW